MVEYKETDFNIQIINSCLVSKRDFDTELDGIERQHPNHLVFAARSRGSLKREWTTHNALWRCHIFRSRTKDVDLNIPQRWYEKLGYAVLGTLCWPFIP